MRKLFCYLKGYGRECILSPLFKLTEALLELLVPLVVAGIIDEGIAHSDTGYIVWNCLLLVGLGLLGLGFSVTAQYFAARAAVGFGEKVRAALFRHISRLPVAELDRLGTATMITRLTSDTNQVQSGVNMTLRLLLRSPFVVFGAMIMAFIIDVRSAMIFVLAIPVLSVVVFGIMLLCIPLYQKVQSRLDRVLGLTRENLSGARVIRAFGREEEESRLFRESNERLTSVQKLVGRSSALMNPLTYILINLAILWLIYEGALRVESGILTQGMVIALYNYMSQILVELVKLASLIILMTKSVDGDRCGAGRRGNGAGTGGGSAGGMLPECEFPVSRCGGPSLAGGESGGPARADGRGDRRNGIGKIHTDQPVVARLRCHGRGNSAGRPGSAGISAAGSACADRTCATEGGAVPREHPGQFAVRESVGERRRPVGSPARGAGGVFCAGEARGTGRNV